MKSLKEIAALVLSNLIWFVLSSLVLGGVLFSILMVLKSMLFYTTSTVSTNSVLFSLTKIDYKQLITLALILIPVLFIVVSLFSVIVLAAYKFKLISENSFNQIIVFSQRLTVSIYPTLVLAGAFDESSFALITSILSFFAMFTFVFKNKKE